MAEDVKCRLLCHSPKSPMTWTEEHSLLVIERIQHEYTVHLYAFTVLIFINIPIWHLH